MITHFSLSADNKKCRRVGANAATGFLGTGGAAHPGFATRASGLSGRFKSAAPPTLPTVPSGIHNPLQYQGIYDGGRYSVFVRALGRPIK
jgi:hypothetical protein